MSYLRALLFGTLVAVATIAMLDSLGEYGPEYQRLWFTMTAFVVVAVCVGGPLALLRHLFLSYRGVALGIGVIVGGLAGAFLVAMTSDASFAYGYMHPDAQLFELSLLVGGLAFGATLEYWGRSRTPAPRSLTAVGD